MGSLAALDRIYPDLGDCANDHRHITCYGCEYLVPFLKNVKLNKTFVFIGSSGSAHEPLY